MYRNFVGIDIAAATFTAAWHDGQHWQDETVDQIATAYKRFARQLGRVAPPAETLIVMEVTGTYWMAVAYFLHQAGFGVSVIAPEQARAFARLEKQRAKTDRIDARLLAQLAQERQPTCWMPPPAIAHHLEQRLRQRDDLIGMRVQEKNRLHALRRNPQAEASILERLQRHIAYLDAEIEALEAEIDTLLSSDHPWAAAAQRLRSIPGLGPITTAWLLVATQCFAFCSSPEQAAAFAGVIPYRRESGTSRHGYRPVGHGGHAALRQALFMAALSAMHHNPALHAFYLRLVERRKPHKVIRIALARKLVHLAWALVVKERVFDPNFAASPVFA